MKNIAVLGSTGSVGTQTLDVIEKNPERFSVWALSCRSNKELLLNQIKKFKPQVAVCGTKEDALYLSSETKSAGLATEILHGPEGLVSVAEGRYDLLVNSLLGISGLVPTFRAINSGHDVALANKETLVTGGKLIMDAVKTAGVRLLPIDSEHNAIFQCLRGNSTRGIDKILLTASGGPFRGYSLKELESVTLQQALNHPKWTMGNKITIDSATMMNKGFEVIEAKWFFGVNPADVHIVVHPQSIIHSMVQYKDHSVISQLGVPDMRIPIGYTLNYPDMLPNDFESVDFFGKDSNLTFESLDLSTFKCAKMAYEVLELGGTYPVALNGANEVLVQLFLEGKIKFIDIQNNIAAALDSHISVSNPGSDDILEADRRVREDVMRKVNRC